MVGGGQPLHDPLPISRHPTHPHRRRAAHRVPGAGHPLRKLHSSHHDSFHAPLGRRGRAAGAYRYAYGFERYRHDRHHSADLHRQEERHHDDRFRPGGGAAGRKERARRHFRGLPAALPPHPDDHHGGHAGRRAAGIRQGRGVGTAPPARHHHHRRPGPQPGAHAVHYAGGLSQIG